MSNPRARDTLVINNLPKVTIDLCFVLDLRVEAQDLVNAVESVFVCYNDTEYQL